MRKGQFTLEFVGAAILFLLTVLTVAVVGAGELPQFREDVSEASLNLETRELTQKMLSSPGYHGYGTGGTDWASNPSRLRNVEEIGLASDYLEVERSKLEALRDSGENYLNYSQFKKVTEANHNYRFRFYWVPILHTSKSFTRGDPPSFIDEEPYHDSYSEADDIVHYGSLYLDGDTRNFLVTSHNGIYDSLYVSDDWGFGVYDPRQKGDTVDFGSTTFTIESFQNRGSNPGTSVMLSTLFKSYGGVVDRSGKVIKMNRYATLKDPVSSDQPLRIEVLAW